MLMVFHCGSSSLQYEKTSVMSRSEGCVGKMYVPRAMYSFRMSFWIVPPSFERSAPCCLATATYSASRIGAVALIVIDVVTCSSGMPSNSVSMSRMLQMDTPTLPTSPSAIGSSGS